MKAGSFQLRIGVLLVLCTFALAAHAGVDITRNSKCRLTSFGNGSVRTYHEYDEHGRAIAAQHVQDGQSRTMRASFDYPVNPDTTGGPGNVLAVQVLPDGERISYAYDAGAQQIAVKSTFNGRTEDVVRRYRANALGNLARVEYGNRTVTTYSYDEAGHQQLTGIRTVDAAGKVIQDYGYTYDKHGNVIGMTDGVWPDESATFDYDELDQLEAIRNSHGNSIEEYTYDHIRNLTVKNGRAQEYGAGGRPHALKVSGPDVYGYDSNGNVTSIGAHTTLEWNAENMSSRVTTPLGVTEKAFVGEAAWKKVEGGIPTYFLPSMRVESGALRKYYGTFAERLESDDRRLRFYHPDHLGSSSVMSDADGKAIRRVSYLPWGQERSVAPKCPENTVPDDRCVEEPFTPELQFNFKEKDDLTGFYDYGARLYNAMTGRWLSPDTHLGDGLNRYAYARNNPWSRIDPDGHQSRFGHIWWEKEHKDRNGTVVRREREFAIKKPGDGFFPSPIPKGGLRIEATFQWGDHGTPVHGAWIIYNDDRQIEPIENVKFVEKGGRILEGNRLEPWEDEAKAKTAAQELVDAMNSNYIVKHFGTILLNFAFEAVTGGAPGAITKLRHGPQYLTSLGIEHMTKIKKGMTFVAGPLSVTKHYVGVEGIAVFRMPDMLYTVGHNRAVVDDAIRHGVTVLVDGWNKAGKWTKWEVDLFTKGGLRLWFMK